MNYTNNPYMNYINPQMNFNNPYMSQRAMANQQAIQQPVQAPSQQPIQQPVQQYNQSLLQGKSVDSIDVVKATDIPLDGSVSYFPLVDGTAIVTKQLQIDGTSKITIYRPINEEEEEKQIPKFITLDEFNKKIKELNNDDFKNDLKSIKRQLKDLQDDMEDINKDLKKRKD